MMQLRMVWTLVLACLVLTSLVFLPSSVHGQGPVKVTVTIAALEQFVLAVGGDRVTVSYFAPPNCGSPRPVIQSVHGGHGSCIAALG